MKTQKGGKRILKRTNNKILAELKKKYPICKKLQDKSEDTRELSSNTSDKDVIDKALIVTCDDTPVTAEQMTTGKAANDTAQPTVDTHVVLINTFVDSSVRNSSLANENLHPSIHEPLAVTAGQTTLGGPANGTAPLADETAHPVNTSFANKCLSPENKTAACIDPKFTSPFPSPHLNIETETTPSAVTETGDNEVGMEHTTPSVSRLQENQNDEELPLWLNPMMGYLHGLTEDMAWQNLVTNFLAFERLQPPSGVSPLFFSFSQVFLEPYYKFYE